MGGYYFTGSAEVNGQAINPASTGATTPGSGFFTTLSFLSGSASFSITSNAGFGASEVTLKVNNGGNTLALQNDAIAGAYSAVACHASGAVVNLTGCSISSNTTVSCSSTSGVLPGMAVTGTGVAAGAYIASVSDATHFVLSASSTNGSGLALACTYGGFEHAAFGVSSDMTSGGWAYIECSDPLTSPTAGLHPPYLTVGRYTYGGSSSSNHTAMYHDYTGKTLFFTKSFPDNTIGSGTPVLSLADNGQVKITYADPVIGLQIECTSLDGISATICQDNSTAEGAAFGYFNQPQATYIRYHNNEIRFISDTVTSTLDQSGNLTLAGGVLKMAALPTSDPHVAGQFYKTAGAVMQSAG